MKKIYGLIGYPVKHSLSALMHNAAFKYLGIDADYKLFETKPEKLKDFFGKFRKKLSGINITIPHKTASMIYMDDLNEEAALIEAINTVVLQGDRLIGYNTDGRGFIRSLKKDLEFDPRGKVAMVLGAGGAGRAVCFSLARENITRIIIIDTDFERSALLAKSVEIKTGAEAIAVEHGKAVIGELLLNSDLLVNATPIGMKKSDPELVPESFLHDGLAVFDLIYNPPETALLKRARKKKIKAVNGLGMLVNQGAIAFELWTGLEAPVRVMRKALKC